MKFFRGLFLSFGMFALLCSNPLFAQKKQTKSPTSATLKKPIVKQSAPKPVYIDFHCMHNNPVSEVIVDGQKLYLQRGQFVANLKLIELSEPNFGLKYAVSFPFRDTIYIRSLFQHFITELKTQLSFAVSEKYYLTYSSLKKKPLVLPANEKLYNLKKGKEFKAILYQLIDFDTIVFGGRGTFTGIYPIELAEFKKPFTLPQLTNYDSAISNKSEYVCFNDPALTGTFVDSATSDTIRVTISSQKPGIRILYKSKGSKNYTAIKSQFHFYPMNTVIGTNQPISYSSKIPYSNSNNFFYFSGNCWVLPGQAATSDEFPDGQIPKGLDLKPFIPAKFFKKIHVNSAHSDF